MHDVLRRLVEQVDFRDPPGARAHAPEVLKAVRAERRLLARDQGFFDLRWKSIERAAEEFVEVEIADRAAHPELDILTEHQGSLRAQRGQRPRARAAMAGGPNRSPGTASGPGRDQNFACSTTRIRAAPIAIASWRRPRCAQFGWTDFQLPVYLMGALNEFDERLAANVTLEAGYLVLRNREKAQIAPVARTLIDPAPKRRAAAIKSGERIRLPIGLSRWSTTRSQAASTSIRASATTGVRIARSAAITKTSAECPEQRRRVNEMARVELTSEQRDAVYAAGNVLVRAGAGSGKTEVLAQRFVALLAGDIARSRAARARSDRRYHVHRKSHRRHASPYRRSARRSDRARRRRRRVARR